MAEKQETFAALLLLADEAQRPLMEQLRKLVLDVHPEACEVIRLGERSATYGIGPKKMSEGYAYLMPQKEWVNLGFFHGAQLSDPKKLLEGTGAKMRHVKVRTSDDAEQAALRKLLLAAVKERKESAK